jgi:hypothetical protein
MYFTSNEQSATMAIEKIKILGAVLELPAKLHCQFGPFSKQMGLILSIAMGADYLFEVKNIEIWVLAFFKHNNSSVATVAITMIIWNSNKLSAKNY